MTHVQIRYFVEAAKQLNFTKAADILFVAQQVISKQVRALETELGYPLFIREPKGLVLTEAGIILFDFWENMMEEQKKAIASARQAMQDEHIILRIGTLPISRLQDMVSNAIHAVSGYKEYIDFNIECDSFRGLRKKLEDNQLDCIISLADENSGLSDAYEEHVFIDLYPKLVISKDHPMFRPDMQVTDLENTTIYILSQKLSRNAKLNTIKYCNFFGYTPKKIQYFDDVGSMEMALNTGKGFALIYAEFFRNPTGNLQSIDLENISLVKSTSFSVTFLKKNARKLKHFVQELIQTKY